MMRGAELKKLRAKLGLSQSELAAELSVHKNTVAKWERDDQPMRPAFEKLIRLLAAQSDK